MKGHLKNYFFYKLIIFIFERKIRNQLKRVAGEKKTFKSDSLTFWDSTEVTILKLSQEILKFGFANPFTTKFCTLNLRQVVVPFCTGTEVGGEGGVETMLSISERFLNTRFKLRLQNF